jgi:hypothetical protein
MRHFLLEFRVQRLKLAFAVKELAGHAWLPDRDAHATLEFAAGHAGLEVRVRRDDHLLLPIDLSLAVAKVLGLLSSCVLVALVQVLNDGRVQVLDLLLKWGKALNSKDIS